MNYSCAQIRKGNVFKPIIAIRRDVDTQAMHEYIYFRLPVFILRPSITLLPYPLLHIRNTQPKEQPNPSLSVFEPIILAVDVSLLPFVFKWQRTYSSSGMNPTQSWKGYLYADKRYVSVLCHLMEAGGREGTPITFRQVLLKTPGAKFSKVAWQRRLLVCRALDCSE